MSDPTPANIFRAEESYAMFHRFRVLVNNTIYACKATFGINNISMTNKLRKFLDDLRSMRLLSNLRKHLSNSISVYPTVIPTCSFCNSAELSDRQLVERVINDKLMELETDFGGGRLVSMTMEVEGAHVFGHSDDMPSEEELMRAVAEYLSTN